MRANSFEYRARPDESTKIQPNSNTSVNEEADDNLLDLLQSNQQPDSFCFQKKRSLKEDERNDSGSPGQKRCPFCQRIFQLNRFDIHRRICEQAHVISQAATSKTPGKKQPERKSSKKLPAAREESQLFERVKERAKYRLYTPPYSYTFDF